MSSFDPSIFKADGLLAANRALDLGRIDAVGFDLDHTLALYDDDAVNALAMAEAQDLLVAERGYRSGEVVVAPHVHDVAVARALAIDLATAHVVKLDAGRRVHVARRGGTWVADAAIVRAHPHPAPDDRERVHPLSSRFDVPTMWLFDAVTRGCEPHRTLDPAAVCRDVREMLDWSHTRGDLKTHLRRELARFVSPVEGVIARLHAWRDAGKRLFVVTNSDTSFAIAVLDLVIGSSWRSMFSVVATSSAKPRFFDGARKGEKPPGADGVVIEGASARMLEELMGARGNRVLYVGDNVRADIRAARAFGWKTVHVVAELAASEPADNRWGSAFAAGESPSWFAHEVGESADIVCDRVDRLLALDPNRAFDVTARFTPAKPS